MKSFEQSLPIPVVLVLPREVQLIGALGLLEVFDAANRLREARGQPPLYALTVAGPAATTRSVTGLPLGTRPLEEVAEAHTVVVAGTLALSQEPAEPALLAPLSRLAARAERVVSVCQGAFLLGELGLLDGRRCTTHWLGLKALRERFPRARVLPDALYTEDGPVFTSAGATAGVDLALHLVRLDGGSRLALAVARAMVVFAHRPGGQSQFSVALRLRSGLDERLEALVADILAAPAADHRVPVLAERAGMSPRNFARVFKEQSGETPAAFVSRVRVEAAQRALAHSDASVAQIAEDCGFGTEATLRRSFQRVKGVSPTEYRGRFSASP